MAPTPYYLSDNQNLTDVELPGEQLASLSYEPLEELSFSSETDRATGGFDIKQSASNVRSLFRSFSMDGSWVPSGGDEGMGMTRFGINTSIMLPGPKLYWDQQSYFRITPKFGYTNVDWKRDTPFPDSLYEVSVGITWMQKFNDQWSGMLTVSPGWASDGEESSDSLCCSALFGLTWTPNSRWKVMFGVAYRDRSDTPVLPFGGVIWTPNDDWKVELTMPQAKVARRLSAWSSDLQQHWIYLGFGFGGGSWAIRSTNEQADIAKYREFSMLLGYEWVRKNMSWKFETDYLFGREMKFDDHTQEKYKPDDAFVLRLKCSF